MSCEAFSYAVFPLCLALVWRLRAGAAAVVAAVVVVVPFLVATLQSSVYLTVHFPPSRLPEFVLGMIAARAVREAWLRVPSVPWCLLLLGVAVSASWLTTSTVTAVALPMVPFTILIVSAAQRDVDGKPSWLGSPALQAAGRTSFAFYLVHVTPLSLVVDRVGEHAFPWPRALAWAAANLAVAVVAAAALHRFVEVPAARRLSGA